ncbi:MAG: ribosome maturation factor RimP [Bacteroidota bacterium]
MPTDAPTTTTPAPGETLADQVRALAEEAAADTDLFVVEVEVRGHQGSRVVAVYADSEAGAGADDLAALSRSLAFALDTEDLVKGRYRLDVSSPGADRPLTYPGQFRKHVGRTLAVEFTEAGETRSLTGSLTGLGGDRLFEIQTADGSTISVLFADLISAKVVLPW